MENQIRVLVIGRHADMLERITNMLDQKGYRSIGKLSNEEAFAVLENEKIDAVIIGGGVDSESRDLFHQEFPKFQAKIKIFDAHPSTVLSDLENAFPNS
jgi:DNA-binding NarL/FixJ family response regulator